MTWLREVPNVRVASLGALVPALVACVRLMHHEPELAGMKAVQFFEAACVKHDWEQARRLVVSTWWMKPSAKTAQKLVDSAGGCGAPTRLVSVAYEPMPGQASIMIYVTADTASGTSLHYRLPVAGTSTDGYLVAGFYRSRTGSFPHPEGRSQLRKVLPPAAPDETARH